MHHRRGLRRHARRAKLEDGWVEEVTDDWRRAALTGAQLAMLAYAEQLTLEPAAVTRDHVESLRAAGYTDRAILDICEVASYYAYVNRIANGLGVELETEDED